jgi:hypothetical protein
MLPLPTARPRPSDPSRRSRLALRCGLATLCLTALAACDRGGADYPASTPALAIDSAQQMILNGETERLTDLVYAENDDMRSFLNQIGSLLASLQTLGDAVESRFPEELAAFRAEGEAAAAEGKSNPLLARLVAANASQRNPTFGVSRIDREGLTLDTGADEPGASSPSDFLAGRASDSQREIFNDILKQLLADPYRWLAEGRDRLDTVYIADDTVALTWDDRPILPPFGLSMIEEDGRWFLVPPTSYPGVRMVMPRNADEWYIWGSMVKTLERVVLDLERDVRSGQVRNMTDLADSATEKVAIPAMLVFFAYGNIMEQRMAEQAAARRAAEQDEDQQDGQPEEPQPDGAADPTPTGPDDEPDDEEATPDQGEGDEDERP